MNDELDDDVSNLTAGDPEDAPSRSGKTGTRPRVGHQSMRRAGRAPNARIHRETPREEARAADPARAPIAGLRLHRKRRIDNPFDVDKRVIPQGYTYQWIRESCYGDKDVDNVVNMRENHWTPVPIARHPEMMPEGETGAIRKKGMILCERPKYLTDEARAEDYQIAREEIARKEAQIYDAPEKFGKQFPRDRRVSGINKTFERVEIPD